MRTATCWHSGHLTTHYPGCPALGLKTACQNRAAYTCMYMHRPPMKSHTTSSRPQASGTPRHELHPCHSTHTHGSWWACMSACTPSADKHQWLQPPASHHSNCTHKTTCSNGCTCNSTLHPPSATLQTCTLELQPAAGCCKFKTCCALPQHQAPKHCSFLHI